MIDWQNVIDKFLQSVFILDLENNILAFNHPAKQFINETIEDPIGQSFDLCVGLSNIHLDTFNISLSHSFEFSQENFSYQVRIEPLLDESDKENGRFISIELATEKTYLNQQIKQAEKHLKTAVETKSNFLDIVSHELRTPLNAVTGHINMLRNTNLDSEQTDLIRAIIENGDRLSSIITKLLEYSQADGTLYELHPTPFNLQALLNEVVPKCTSKIYDKPIKVNWSILEGSPTVLLADSIRIRQLLTYLLENATKFTEEGSINITAGVKKQSDQSLILEISVGDTGIGIPASHQDQIIQPFYQKDTSLTRGFEGLGLSLAIVEKICSHMNGSLRFKSQEGIGSIFTISLAVEESDAVPVNKNVNNNLALRDKKILLIGRNADYRRTISRDAKLAGMYPYVASSLSEAQYWINKDNFDIICIEETLLIDSNGFLNNLESLNNEIAFILIDENLNTEFLDFQFDCILTAPFSSSAIYDIFIRSLHISHNQKKSETDELKLNEKMAEHHPLQIILIEDNMINKKVAERMLNRLGYHVDHAANGQIGLDLISENNYDVVLMDIQMPVMDGITATRKIRQLKNKIKQPTIIAVTAHAREGDREKYLSNGMNNYISKPIKMDTLVGVLYSCNPIEDQFDKEMPQMVGSSINNQGGINYDILQDLFGEDIEEFLIEMVPVFLEDSQKLIDKIKLAIPVGNLKSIQEALHALKGSSASLGMEELSMLCTEFEKRQDLIEPFEVEKLFSQVQTEHGRICDYLKNKYQKVPI